MHKKRASGVIFLDTTNVYVNVTAECEKYSHIAQYSTTIIISSRKGIKMHF